MSLWSNISLSLSIPHQDPPFLLSSLCLTSLLCLLLSLCCRTISYLQPYNNPSPVDSNQFSFIHSLDFILMLPNKVFAKFHINSLLATSTIEAVLSSKLNISPSYLILWWHIPLVVVLPQILSLGANFRVVLWFCQF